MGDNSRAEPQGGELKGVSYPLLNLGTPQGAEIRAEIT